MSGGAERVRSGGLDAAWVREEVDGFVGDYLDGLGFEAGLSEGLRYAVLGPGKRARPRLVLESFVAAGGEVGGAGWGDALAAAGSVEMVHAFSLVHDDLPALDDDAVRRGRATVHAAYGEAMAVLVGDGLLALAFRLLSERVGDAALAGRLVAELSAGTSRMVNGQVLDTFGGAVVGGVEGLRGIHRAKTGALIRVSCRMGGLCAGVGAGAPGLAALTGYGEDVGLMFQVVDDLLDVEGEAEAVGKATGKDAAAGKLTYPGVLGVAGSRAEVERLRASALGRLSALEAGGGDRVGGLVRMCEELAKRTA